MWRRFGLLSWRVAGYDPSGRLVAVRVFTDVQSYCNHTSFNILYGEMPDCDVSTTEDLCPRQMRFEEL